MNCSLLTYSSSVLTSFLPLAPVTLGLPLAMCTSHVSEIDEVCAHFMHAIASNLPIDLGRLMFNLILASSLENTARGFLLFGILITAFLRNHQIVPASHETCIPPGKPISRWTLLLSNAHLGFAAPPPHLRPHTVMFNLILWRLCLLTMRHYLHPVLVHPPRLLLLLLLSLLLLCLTINALVAHIDMIHKDLIERIGHVHKRVDRIAERYEHDIKAIRDTLSTLSQWHTQFITDVNTFIQSIRHR
ncbi:hypothetical protein Acr_05g0013670 [Actinidia rufa]|uniref:Uncharacterized protein n=1 Tax=Actinidia rufa TaxID=165716 RepID=A0A7J0EMM6_9ERIC|nr:hypothetical protein Acr_05g0013670 [Actinidia rufa]